MSVYKKLADARVKLQQSGLKKSGLNKFANYDYFELCDFLPKINEINNEVGLCTIVSFGTELATLKIIDVDKSDEVIEITSPMEKAELKGCHSIQNLGAVESYQRRYLYMTAYEIAENDVLDATTGKDNKTNKESTGTKETNQEGKSTLSEKQVARAIAIGKSHGIDIGTIKKQIMKDYKVTDIAQLTKAQYDELCERLAKAGEKSA